MDLITTNPPHSQLTIGNYPNYNGSYTAYDYGVEIFCSGSTFLEDGTLLIAGGHDHSSGHGNGWGLTDITLFKYTESSPFSKANDMAEGRWYPTCVHLPNRRVFINMGTITSGDGDRNKHPDLWVKRPSGQYSAGFVSNLPLMDLEGYYPHMFVDPRDGNVLYAASGRAGEDLGSQRCRKFNLVTSSWSDDLDFPTGFTNVRRYYSSAVMINGIIVASGGSIDTSTSNSVKTTAYCNLNVSEPTWTNGPDMNNERMNHTLVALPDGSVLAMGGNLKGESDEGESDKTVRTAPEMWDPAQPSVAWLLYNKPPSGQQIHRGYHSTALLLPDARVIIAGGEPEAPGQSEDPHRKMQIFSPPYGGTNNWASLRPTINSCPTTIRYGETFTVNASHGTSRQMKSISLVSIGSTTHAFNENQRFVTLAKTSAGSGNWTVTPPSNPNIAPPGYYMLFVNDEAVPSITTWMGVPSEARIVKLVDYSMILADTSGLSLTTGTYQGSATIEQTYIGDQTYLGTYINANSITKVAELEVVGTAHERSNANSKVRVQAECKASVSGADLKLYLWNWSTSAWVQIGSTFSLGNADTEAKFEAISTDAGGASPYINSSDNKVKAKLRWSAPIGNPAAFYLDVVEMGIKQ